MPGSGVEPTDLVPVDEAVLAELLDVAASDASPEEVMPPVDGEPGWTRARRDAFVAYHRSRGACRGGRSRRSRMRCAPTAGSSVPHARGSLRRQDREPANSARRLLACTTTGNGAALGALTRQEFSIERSADGRVTAALPLV